ncbi:hypothetical protein EOD41_09850 [Mucilaginibacter limnophilus]|uniref:Rhamnogalacturonase A/B/Epimerase-like pectate lyase domain-containing protein n=1 Tax=Mucilaginibacter limnophilus TaxID=1932778 RepID=A0A437MTE2_9SPHI|nr:glycosyl hydrolase family 28-related protein [Mucilaginibacter limnophilus]RVU00927.1 hypothetical protein EOD41_09850 [Mucilaginibacter limnophilus]
MKRILYITIVLSALVLSVQGFASIQSAKKVSVRDFGAKGDGITDDSEAFLRAIKAADFVVVPKGKYLLKKKLSFTKLSNKTISAYGATIINNNTELGTLYFGSSINITIEGGTWTRKTMPDHISNLPSEHTFSFVRVRNLTVKKVHINGSAQMGINMVLVDNATVYGNLIENCYRDGIYAHYSVNLTYESNTLNNIKDDAMSIHDYGIDAQKQEMFSAGYRQSGKSRIINNVTNNTYEGFASIGCDGLLISGNKINNTVNAGISIFNTPKLFKGSNARAKNITITNNYLSYTGGTQRIMGEEYKNQGQLTGGRSAIFVGVQDEQALINNPDPKSRITDVTITNNTVVNSYVNGAYIGQVDNLEFKNNTFTDCNIAMSNFSGRIVEIRLCNNVDIDDNSVIDDRSKPRHNAGYELKNVNGRMGKWIIKGHIDQADKYIIGSSPVSISQ